MKRHAPVPLTYLPVYLGLFASLLLAMTCNAFLDIRYGTFGFEVLVWALVFGLSLRLGWRQRGSVTADGKQGQRMALILGAIVSVIVIIPIWGFPRAGIAMLGMLQAAQNCVTVSRRDMHVGLLVSLTMVMFAAVHYRADWTMLFYLVPYVIAVVFTLVAEQINRRVQDLGSRSLSPGMVGNQGLAIAAATAAILALGGVLYALTPQTVQPYLNWDYGQPSNLGRIGQDQGSAGAGQFGGQSGSGGGAGGGSSGSPGGMASGSSGWPTAGQMREAAGRKGMPEWQRSAIYVLADATDWVEQTVEPIGQALKRRMQSLSDWLHAHRPQIIRTLLVLLLLAVLYALWHLLKEAKAGTWLRTRFDYLRYGVAGWHGRGVGGAGRLYAAMERMFELQDTRRSPRSTAREYLAQLRERHAYLYRETAEMTRLYEDVRYGEVADDGRALSRMRELYRRIYREA